MYTFKRRYLTTLFILALFATAFFITGCASGDMATVTINTGIHRQASAAEATLFERFLAFLHPGTTAYAESAISFDDAIEILNVTITGPGMSVIKKDIPLDTGILSVDVPSGPARIFTVVAYYDYGEEEGTERKYGGIATKDLAAGESVILPIQMGELPMIPSDPYAYTSYGITLYWDYYGDPESLIGFIIYRSSQLDGLFVPIAAGRKEDFENDGYRFNDPTGGSSTSPNPSFYKIAATNAYGVGQSTYAVYSSC